MTIIFIHGWGYNFTFWDDLSAQLSADDSPVFDFGYLDQDRVMPEGSAVYITHSLGTMWALKNRAASMKGLISINGFACFQDFVQQRVLEAMQKRLARMPDKQMQAFWQMAGHVPEHESLDQQALAGGLSFLAQGDERQSLSDLSCPVMALAGDQDEVTDINVMQSQWQNYDLRICKGGGHALPQTDAQWCAKQIKDFTDALG